MQNSNIEWTDHTFNGWIGCTKVSTECLNCYAETFNERFGGGNWGKGAPRRRTSEDNWRGPINWNRTAARYPFRCPVHGPCLYEDCPSCEHSNLPNRPRVFCASMADWLDEEVDKNIRADLLNLIDKTRNLDWLLLSKRPQSWYKLLADAVPKIFSREDMVPQWLEGNPPPHVWMGASAGNQKYADERIPELVRIPARVRFLSVEPMLGPIDLAAAAFNGADSFGSMPGIHWVIFGGESGPGARPCNVEWIRDGVRQCRAAGVAPFVKQLGSNRHDNGKSIHSDFARERGAWMDKKGGDPLEWPADLRVREFPKIT